ncbi:MAG: hypothetical protein KatS3mg105_5255 [Gemmatales bacterium]|nr:MAG: hypothetical protein KatS3mg105_5255 [Gemmatales bacterium]GIW99417.1 MAG: hypothetical protein KatS3mg111_2750 [Pirellulaceae bacterium]
MLLGEMGWDYQSLRDASFQRSANWNALFDPSTGQFDTSYSVAGDDEVQLSGYEYHPTNTNLWKSPLEEALEELFPLDYLDSASSSCTPDFRAYDAPGAGANGDSSLGDQPSESIAAPEPESSPQELEPTRIYPLAIDSSGQIYADMTRSYTDLLVLPAQEAKYLQFTGGLYPYAKHSYLQELARERARSEAHAAVAGVAVMVGAAAAIYEAPPALLGAGAYQIADFAADELVSYASGGAIPFLPTGPSDIIKGASRRAAKGVVAPRGALQGLESFKFRGASCIDGLREATHADIVNAFKGTGYTPSNHFITRLKDVRTDRLGIRTFKDVETIFRKGSVFDADDGAVAIVHNGMAIIVDPATKRLITLRPW